MNIITKPDSSIQKLCATGVDGPEMEGWYSDAPAVGERFRFWWVASNGEMCYLTTSPVVSMFGSLDGYLIKTQNSDYVIREFLDG